MDINSSVDISALPQVSRAHRRALRRACAGKRRYATTAPGTSNTADRTLDIVYGPEHKHYVNAGGVTFALFTSRTGTLNGLAATTRSYFHHDHLGSIAVVTDENGAVTERLAYDPWGRRRFVNSVAGAPDNLDAIVGQKTDRGFTMHEHLDEIGIIHMNGRVYDPLIGRFKSADPYNQAPLNLKSFNRYSCAWNNPLKLIDPEGFNASDTVSGDFGDVGNMGPSPSDGVSEGLPQPSQPVTFTAGLTCHVPLAGHITVSFGITFNGKGQLSDIGFIAEGPPVNLGF